MKKIKLLLIIIFCNLGITQAQDATTTQWLTSGGGNVSPQVIGDLDDYTTGTKLGTDNNGNIYLIANVAGNVQIDTSNFNAGISTIALISYNCAGKLRWVKYVGYGTSCLGSRVCTGKQGIDKDGNIYITGQINGYIGVPQIIMLDTILPFSNSTPMNKNFFMMKIDSNGIRKWLRFSDINANNPLQSPKEFYPLGMALDENNNMRILTITYEDSSAINGQIIPTLGWHILTINGQTGNLMNFVKIQNEHSLNSTELMTFHYYNNNYYIIGSTYDTTKFGSTILYTPPNCNGYKFCAKFGANGNAVWARAFVEQNPPTNPERLVNFNLKGNVQDNMVLMQGQVVTNINLDTGSFNGIQIYAPTWAPSPYSPQGIFVALDTATGNTLNVWHYESEVVSNCSAIKKIGNKLVNSTMTRGKLVLNGDTTIMDNIPNQLDIYTSVIDLNTNQVVSKGIIQSNTYNSYIEAIEKSQKNDDIIIGGVINDSLFDSNGNGVFGAYNSVGGFFVGKLALTNTCNCVTALANINQNTMVGKTLTTKGFAAGMVDSLVWYWGDGTSTAYATQNTAINHTYANNGTYTVCLKTYNSCGTDDTCFIIKLAESITQVNLAEIKMYPNPASNFITIENPTGYTASINIYNLQGALLTTKTAKKSVEVIEINSLANGVYVVEIVLGDRKEVRKLVVRN